MNSGNFQRQLDFIWLNGGADEQEEILQLILDLWEESGKPFPENFQEASVDVGTVQKLLEGLKSHLNPDQTRSLAVLLEDVAQRIAAARHRDITLI